MTATLPLPITNDVALYVRLTREESRTTGLSGPAQKNDGRESCKRFGLPSPHVYEEPIAIGADVPFDKRPEGRRLLEDINNGRIRHVVVRHQDRLVRDTGLWSEFSKLIRKKGVRFYTFNGEIELKSADGRLSANFQAAIAQHEKEKTGERVSRAKAQLARIGRHTGGPPPFGYTMRAARRRELIKAGLTADEADIQATQEFERGKHLYVIESEAAIVRQIFRLYVDKRLGCRSIAIKLNTAGQRRRSGLPWHPDKIRKILRNPEMAGYIGDNGTLHKGQHEAIVTREIWDKAQECLKRNRLIAPDGTANANKQYRFALSGIMTCGCGSPMRSKRTDNGHSYYVCQKRYQYGPEACNGPRVRTDKAHDALWSHLTPLFESKDCLDRVFAAVRKLQANRESMARKNVTIEQQIGKVEQDLSVWYERHDRATNDNQKEAAWTRIQALMEQKNQLIIESRSTPRLSIKSISRSDLAKDLARVSKLIRQSADRGRGLVEALVHHHCLAVRLLDAETIEVSLNLSLPGSCAMVPVSDVVTLPTDKITAWLQEQRAVEHPCSECGKPVDVERRHFWRGIPTVHHGCMGKLLAKKRKPADGYTGCDVARILGVGRTTVGRMVKAGTLVPIRANGRLLVFDKAVVDRLARQLER